MMIPAVDSLWKFTGPGNGHNDLQRVIASDDIEVVTISERSHIHQIEWSGLFPTRDFPKFFKFAAFQEL